MSRRAEKVAETIKRRVCEIVRDDLRDPSLGFLTITSVSITDDLRFCKIYYSVMGDEKVKKQTGLALNRAKGFVKKLIGDSIELRCVPEIIFKVDETMEEMNRINALVKKVRDEDAQR